MTRRKFARGILARGIPGLLAATALLAAGGCGNGISGRYSDTSGETFYEFMPDGHAAITILDITVAAEYSLDDDRIIVTSPQGTVVLKRNGETLTGPMGLELSRIKAGKNERRKSWL